MIEISQVTTETQRANAAALIREYLHWIADSAQREYGLSINVEAMVASDMTDREKFEPPFGRFYLVQEGEEAVGVGCLKRLNDQVGEIQRMYVRSTHRGRGIGRLAIDRLVADAKVIGYTTVRLESLKFLSAAHALYRSAGFVEIDLYADNSMEKYHAPDAAPAYLASAVFMELLL